jgi:hypothetical protein
LVLIAYTNGSEARIGDSYLLPVMAVVAGGTTGWRSGNLVGRQAALIRPSSIWDEYPGGSGYLESWWTLTQVRLADQPSEAA